MTNSYFYKPGEVNKIMDHVTGLNKDMNDDFFSGTKFASVAAVIACVVA